MQTFIKIILMIDCFYGMLVGLSFFAHGFTCPMSEDESKGYFKDILIPFVIAIACLIFLK